MYSILIPVECVFCLELSYSYAHQFPDDISTAIIVSTCRHDLSRFRVWTFLKSTWTIDIADLEKGVSKNRGGPPKSSILIGISLINHPFLGTIIFGNTQNYPTYEIYGRWLCTRGLFDPHHVIMCLVSYKSSHLNRYESFAFNRLQEIGTHLAAPLSPVK